MLIFHISFKVLLLGGTKKKKEKEYTFKTRLKERVPKLPTSPLRSAMKNAKIISSSPDKAKEKFNLKFVKAGNHVLRNANK